MNIRKRPDLAVAFALCLLSCIFSVIAYNSLARAQNISAPNVLVFPMGQNLFFLRSGPDCVAKMDFKTTLQNGEFRIDSSGAFNVEMGQQKLSIPMTFLAVFNSLGQLGASILRLKSSAGDVVIGTKGVDPITLVVRSDIPGKQQRFEVLLPGPVQAKAQAQNLRIAFPGAASLRTRSDQPLLAALLRSFQLSLVNDREQPSVCEVNSLGYLQLGALKNLLEHTIGHGHFVTP